MILTRKIKLSVIGNGSSEEELKNSRNDIYSYLRDSIYAQNKAFNILTSAVYSAKLEGKSDQRIKDIYYSYEHQSPDPQMAKQKTLEKAFKLAPITEEIIEQEVLELKRFLIEKGKSEKSIEQSCKKERKDLEKFLGMPKEDVEHKLYMMLEHYCAYPEEVWSKFANSTKTPAYVTKQVKEYFSAFGSDVLSGKAALRNIKMDNPLILDPALFVRNGEIIGLTHEYEGDLDEHILKDRNLELFLELPYRKEAKSKMKFQLILGNPHKSQSIRNELLQIFKGEYQIKGSKIGFTKNKKSGKQTDLTLFLSMEVPKVDEYIPLQGVVVGVDLGQSIPAVCALNTNSYVRRSIGDGKDFTAKKKEFKDRRKRISKSISKAHGGHGRKRKLKALEHIQECERNWCNTYSHKISSQVVKFAVDNQAEYIYIENLEGINDDARQQRQRAVEIATENASNVTELNKAYKKSDLILGNWNYYKLQEQITYKAQKYGIKVRKINPYHTSQVCSCCGHWEEGQRISQSDFVCKNPECENYGRKINADFNAARNIAMSDDIVSEFNGVKWIKVKKEKSRKAA